MARRSKKNKWSPLGWWRSRRAEAPEPGTRRRWRVAFTVVAVIGALVGLTYGMIVMERDVRQANAARGPARITFVERPVGMEPITEAALAPFAEVPWSSPTICRDIADALRATGWVAAVDRVHRFPDRRIEVSCTFRRPVALARAPQGWCLVDADCVRLPGWYTNDPDYLLIVGVAQPPPSPGEVWPGEDIRAGVALVRLLAGEPFSNQLTGILVDNHAGRRDPHRAQLLLATDRAGGRIVWGSPIGQEIEENTVAQKLNLLRSNYQRFGRVDGDRDLLDVSVHPDRVIAPAHAEADDGALAGM